MSRSRASLKPIREIKAMYEAEGVEINAIEQGRRAHYKVRARYRGTDFMVVFACSSSDRRSTLNHRTNLRNIKRQIDEGTYRQ